MLHPILPSVLISTFKTSPKPFFSPAWQKRFSLFCLTDAEILIHALVSYPFDYCNLMFCALHVCIKKSSVVFTISHRLCLPYIGSLIPSHQTLKWFCRHVKLYCEGGGLLAYLVNHRITFTMILRQKNHSYESISCKPYYQGWTYSFSFLPMCMAKNISCLGLWQPMGISPTRAKRC